MAENFQRKKTLIFVLIIISFANSTIKILIFGKIIFLIFKTLTFKIFRKYYPFTHLVPWKHVKKLVNMYHWSNKYGIFKNLKTFFNF